MQAAHPGGTPHTAHSRMREHPQPPRPHPPHHTHAHTHTHLLRVLGANVGHDRLHHAQEHCLRGTHVVQWGVAGQGAWRVNSVGQYSGCHVGACAAAAARRQRRQQCRAQQRRRRLRMQASQPPAPPPARALVQSSSFRPHSDAQALTWATTASGLAGGSSCSNPCTVCASSCCGARPSGARGGRGACEQPAGRAIQAQPRALPSLRLPAVSAARRASTPHHPLRAHHACTLCVQARPAQPSAARPTWQYTSYSLRLLYDTSSVSPAASK